MNILAIDLGGSTVKVCVNGHSEIRKAPSGPEMTPQRMVDQVRELARGWHYDVVSLGYPGVVRGGRPAREPHNLCDGWVGFDYRAAFALPIRIVNDAAMQAVGSYTSGRMLFLGLGTGLGSAMVIYGTVQAMELSQLPYKGGGTFGDYLGQRGLDRQGVGAWQKDVVAVSALLREALVADYLVLGGGNVRYLDRLPPFARPGHNANAFEGGYRLWLDPDIRI